MNLGELLRQMQEDGIITVHSIGTDETTIELNTYLDLNNVDPETPIPVWNPNAEAWEV